MLKDKITPKESQIIYLSSIVLIFLSLCVIPTIGLILGIKNFQCDGCDFFNNLLVTIIGIITWSIFYGVFHLTFFAKDYRSTKISPTTLLKIYPKFLQISMRDKHIQSASMLVLITIVYLLIWRLFFLQLFELIHGL
jgi:hypothetical protein